MMFLYSVIIGYLRILIRNKLWNLHHENMGLCNERISAVTTTIAIKSQGKIISKSVKSISRENDDLIYSRLGCDSHADISCAGSDALVLEFIEGRTCTVHPFNETYRPKEKVQLCNVAFAFDTAEGETYILKLNQCLDFRDEMHNSLVSTNQVRSHGIIVEDTPNLNNGWKD